MPRTAGTWTESSIAALLGRLQDGLCGGAQESRCSAWPIFPHLGSRGTPRANLIGPWSFPSSAECSLGGDSVVQYVRANRVHARVDSGVNRQGQLASNSVFEHILDSHFAERVSLPWKTS